MNRLDVGTVASDKQGSAIERAHQVEQRCCDPETQEACCGIEAQAKAKSLHVQFLYGDLSVCHRCQATDTGLDEVIHDVAGLLEEAGVEVVVNKIHVKNEDQARELGFLSSPTIRITGRDIQPQITGNRCEDCGELCGEDVNCRVWMYRGREYTTPPKGLIIDAILQEIYGSMSHNPKVERKTDTIPDNLKRFFAGKERAETDQYEERAS